MNRHHVIDDALEVVQALAVRGRVHPIDRLNLRRRRLGQQTSALHVAQQ